MEQDWEDTGYFESADPILIFFFKNNLGGCSPRWETQGAKGSQLCSQRGSPCPDAKLTLALLLN